MAVVAALVVVGINVFLAVNYLSNLPTIGTASLTMAGAAIGVYILFCAYLIFDMALHMVSKSTWAFGWIYTQSVATFRRSSVIT